MTPATSPSNSPALTVLQHTTVPALVFASPAADDDATVLDLRATDLPVSDVTLRNDVRQRWRDSKRIVVRIDEAPTVQIVALLLEMSRREVRISADVVDRFPADQSVVVRTAAAAPPAALVPFFPVRVRAAPSKTTNTTTNTTTTAKDQTTKTPVRAPKVTHAGRR